MVLGININNYLASDENILSEYKVKKNHFYATDRRIIYTQKGKLVDASYSHINSIQIDIIKYKAFIILGVLIFIIGIAVALGSHSAGIVLIVIGIILLALYFVYKKSEYSIVMSSGDKIHIPRTRSGNVEQFVKIIRDRVK